VIGSSGNKSHGRGSRQLTHIRDCDFGALESAFPVLMLGSGTGFFSNNDRTAFAVVASHQ